MNILCPLSNIDEIDLLIEEPVNELYFGINNQKILFNNRRPSTFCNMEKSKKLRDSLSRAVDRGIRLNLACNAFIYPPDKLHYLLEDVLYCYDIGVRDIIISDINAMLFIKNNNHHKDLRYTLSTCAPVYNSETVTFYQSLGITRICLPRHLSLAEMGALTRKHPEMEFEVIGLNVRCINEDGLCCFEHGLHNYDSALEGGGCQLKYEATAFVNDKIDDISKRIIQKRFECVQGKFISACAACMIPELNKANIGYLKIAGREFTIVRKIRDIRFIRQCIDCANSFDSITEYQKKARELYLNYYKKVCDATQCYYS